MQNEEGICYQVKNLARRHMPNQLYEKEWSTYEENVLAMRTRFILIVKSLQFLASFMMDQEDLTLKFIEKGELNN